MKYIKLYEEIDSFDFQEEWEESDNTTKHYLSNSPNNCPVCGSDEKIYGNACGACAAGVEYWTSGECKNKTFQLSNGRKAEIKIMPETASEKAIERLGELNFTIELKEVGSGNQTRAVYEVRGEKEGRFLGLFKVRANVSVEVDAESGEVLRVRKPWWSFLASGI
jgi:hypothetical protein